MEITRLGFGDDAVDYASTWDLQRRLHAEVVAHERDETVLLLEHQAVFTAGKRTEPHERPVGSVPVIDVDRGGKITWHGPGQIVGYPLMRLPIPIDVVAYVRRVEDLLMAVCAEFGVTTARVDGRSGVWVPADSHGPDRKIAAIGIRVSQRATMHGFALNCDNDLAPFGAIVPCGIADAGVTSLTAEVGRRVGVQEALPIVERHLAAGVLAAPHSTSTPQEVSA